MTQKVYNLPYTAGTYEQLESTSFDFDVLAISRTAKNINLSLMLFG